MNQTVVVVDDGCNVGDVVGVKVGAAIVGNDVVGISVVGKDRSDVGESDEISVG